MSTVAESLALLDEYQVMIGTSDTFFAMYDKEEGRDEDFVLSSVEP
jgi:hypothetical protein